jgi:hypothetical protein
MLEKSNLEVLKNCIPLEALSQTFKDAIEIARELGFAYIWIDSLCIIQDDPEDWKRESALMRDVYGGSGLNIAASGAVDGRSGCFFKLPQNRICQVQVKQGNQFWSYDCVTSRIYSDCLSEMPLMKRGWALQERLLPPRSLQFTSTEVFWECHEKVACETFPEQVPTYLTYHGQFFEKKPISRSMWHWIVELYSECQLTYTKDKLIAISGLARIIQEQTRDQYVAGMWRKDLELQLCWFKSFGIGQDQRVLPYRAPTWSWASLDCRTVMYGEIQGNGGVDIWIQVLDVQLQALDSNPLGQLSTAELRLSCLYLVDVGVRIHESLGVVFGALIIDGQSFNCVIYFDCLGEDEHYKLQEAKAMPVYMTSRFGLTGLLLEHTGKQRGQYQRIGCFSFFPSSSEHSKAFVSNMVKPSYQVAEEECLEIQKDEDGKTKRIITLV